MVESVRTADKTTLIDYALQPKTGIVHLLEPFGETQDFPRRIEHGNADIVAPHLHLLQIPLVTVTGSVQFQVGHQLPQDEGKGIVGHDKPVNPVRTHQTDDSKGKFHPFLR